MALPTRQSAFLWGPRKTGKTTFLTQRFPKSLRYDLLQTDVLFDLLKRPWRLREEIEAAPAALRSIPVIIDEVQKAPALLDEVHWLIENRHIQFVLTGSSARKLKRGRANLLGGRAWRFEMHPLVSREIPDLDLLRALQRGLLPAHYLDPHYRRSLQAYVRDYLKEEVFDEGLTRNIPAFSRFFDALGYSHGERTNYANIARDCGVDAKTVKEYYQIVTDTLLGSMLAPFAKRGSRSVIIKSGKFYLFDVGVAGAITKRTLAAPRGEEFGRAFEHFILMEIQAHRAYHSLDYDIRFWRTKSGLEVDFVLGAGEIAIEVKSGSLRPENFRGIRAFVDEHHPRAAIVVSLESRPSVRDGIQVLPWREFLRRLWDGELLS